MTDSYGLNRTRRLDAEQHSKGAQFSVQIQKLASGICEDTLELS